MVLSGGLSVVLVVLTGGGIGIFESRFCSPSVPPLAPAVDFRGCFLAPFRVRTRCADPPIFGAMKGLILAIFWVLFDGFEGMTIFVMLASKFGLKMRTASIFPLDGCREGTKKRVFPPVSACRLKPG